LRVGGDDLGWYWWLSRRGYIAWLPTALSATRLV